MGKEGDKEGQEPNLEEAIDTFMDLLPNMLLDGHEGKWVILRNEDEKPYKGYWHCAKDAYKVATADFGVTTVLIREVSMEYHIHGRYGKPVPVLSPLGTTPS